MRLRWLLIALVTFSLAPSLASARSRIRRPTFEVAVSTERKVYAGTLVLEYTNRYEVDVDAPLPSTVEVSGIVIAYDTTKSMMLGPHETRTIRLELDDATTSLSPGRYPVTVRWSDRVITADAFVPYQCGLRYTPPPLPAPASPSRWPYVLWLALFGLALAAIVVGRVAKRAGTTDVRVPCSAI